MFDDDQQTPNTLNCAFEFDLPDGKRKMMEFEVRHWITNNEAGVGRGDLVAGKEALLRPSQHDWQHLLWLEWIPRRRATKMRRATRLGLGKDEKAGPHGHGGGDHFANFIDCVTNRKKGDLNAPIEEGHVSSALMHLANASYRLGRTLHFDSESEQVIGDDEANALLRDAETGVIVRRSLYPRKSRRRPLDQFDLSR